ncbi:MAG: D-proline reductase (dithiol) proprotein PrdA [Sporolactobacillus sp.]
MSITLETANQHKDDPAVLCCLTHKDTVLSPENLEDPAIIPDLEESGLLDIPEGSLMIGQVLGCMLIKEADAMTALTPDIVNLPQVKSEKAAVHPDPLMQLGESAGRIRLAIDELKGLTLEIPADISLGGLFSSAPAALTEPKQEDKILRTLKQREFQVTQALIGETTAFEEGILMVRESLSVDSLQADPLVKEVEIDVIPPESRHIYSDTIMDVIPIAAKVEGVLGEGVTHVLNGVVVVLTGIDEKGVQVHEFGSCEGFLDEKIRYGRPGCPDPDDIMIRIHVTLQENTGMERRGPYAAHKACDAIIQEIREVLKKTPADRAFKENIFYDRKKMGRPRVMLVKEIMGQGAMHDNVLLPAEPAGVQGGQRNVDLGNVPVVLSANEVRDGGIHALTCIGPSTKEDTRHYFREPLVNLMAEDDQIDLVGVVFIGSPQVNDEKSYVSARLGALAESINVDGAIVTTEGFGNNHIDFAENIDQIGRRGIQVVGVSYCAYQGQLVVGNPYMDAMIELNKDPEGFENEILGESTLCPPDAERALLMLKTKMAGIPIQPAERKWSQDVIDTNQRLVQ